jgi:hypothetical protein
MELNTNIMINLIEREMGSNYWWIYSSLLFKS